MCLYDLTSVDIVGRCFAVFHKGVTVDINIYQAEEMCHSRSEGLKFLLSRKKMDFGSLWAELHSFFFLLLVFHYFLLAGGHWKEKKEKFVSASED